MAVALPKRSDLNEKYTWNLASIYPNDDARQADIQKVEEALPRLESYKGHLGDSAQKLLEWFREVDAFTPIVGHIAVYGSMLYDGDTTNQAAAAIRDQGF